MSENISSSAIREFLGEAEEIFEKLNLDLVELGERADSGESDPDLLNSIFRGAHSLKGLAGMFGFTDIGELSHHMENLLDSLRLGKVPLNEILVETLFESLESLTRLVHGKGEKIEFTLDIAPLITKISGVLQGGGSDNRGDLLANANIDDAILSVLTEFEEHRLLENLKQGRNLLKVKAVFALESFDKELAEMTASIKKEGEVISTLPSSSVDISEGIAFELLVGTTKSSEQIAALLGETKVEVEEISAGTPRAVTEEAPEQSAAVAQIGDEQTGSLRSISRMVRVDIEKLDSLMNIVGELVLAKAAIGDVGERLKTLGNVELGADLQKATRILERRLEELQKGVMDVRMVPVSQLFDKLTRIVRRVSSESGKKVSLEIVGADTELDKLIVEELSDPLVHIIRNSIDHGVESSSERSAAGKSEKGSIALKAYQKGNHVVIEVSDDGRGIDPDKVREKAIAKKLIDKNIELSKEEIIDLIFLPGFSTQEEVSDLSGRGVGMDVVKNNIASLSGMIEIDTEKGAGTRISLTLPITLAIIKALVIEVCNKTYAVPINSVLETLMIESSAIRTIERREVIELREQTLPLIRLGKVFDLPGGNVKQENYFVVVVGLADKRVGLLVDELMGQQDVVIKSLGEALNFIKGFAGAADLGKQKTILVLDVGGLITEALRGEASSYV